MLKWSDFRTFQSKSSYCTFCRPKYCAWAGCAARIASTERRIARSDPTVDRRDILTPCIDEIERQIRITRKCKACTGSNVRTFQPGFVCPEYCASAIRAN